MNESESKNPLNSAPADGRSPENPFDNDKTLVFDSLRDESGSAAIPPEKLRSALNVDSVNHVEDFKRLRAIGIGGIGAVFSAVEPGLNREIALKVLRPAYRNQSERIDGFIREARISAQIDHPNIVPVHRMGVFDDVGVYFTMKKVVGETLRSVLRKLDDNVEDYRHNYSLRRLLEIFLGTCHGVAFAHRHGIIHCDLKPGNLMVGDYGEIMVMDWGLARSRNEKNLQFELPGRDTPPLNDVIETSCCPGGTPAFMAPELVSRPLANPKSEKRNIYSTMMVPVQKVEPDELTDIYALGVILYAILTWKSSAFDVNLPLEDLLKQVAAGKFMRPCKAAPKCRPVSRELEAICLKAMNRNREKRYQTVQSLIRDVRNYLDGYTVSAYSPSIFYRFSKLLLRHPLIPAAVLAGCLTWLGFYLLASYNTMTRSNANLRLAEYNFSKGMENHLWIQRTLRMLQQNPERENHDLLLEQELIRQSGEMENNYKAALELVARTEKFGLKDPRAITMMREIFRNLIAFYSQTGNETQMLSFLRQSRSRWKDWLDRLSLENSEFRHFLLQIRRRRGTLCLKNSVEFSGDDWLSLEKDGKKIPLPLPASAKNTEALTEIPLQKGMQMIPLTSGDYQLEIRRKDESVPFLVMPVRIPLAGTFELDLQKRFRSIPGMVYIPAGIFFSRGGGSLLPTGRVAQKAFFIGKTEVTIGQYYDFWKTLPDGPEKGAWRPCRRFSGSHGEVLPVWDEKGNVCSPLNRNFPVTGIPAEAALAFCRALGRQYDMLGDLPSRAEWCRAAEGVDNRYYSWGRVFRPGVALLAGEKAAREYPDGAPTGSFPEDVSPFGLLDMTGNVREFLRNDGDTGIFRNVAGGSYLTVPGLARSGEFHCVAGAADDVGFRAVLHPAQSALPQNKISTNDLKEK